MKDDPITVWISELKAGDAESAEQLWHKYFQRLTAFARKKLTRLPVRASDEEDVALSAFHSFCNGAADGRFPRLADRNSLWPLLAMIAARKVYDAATRERRQKRGGGLVRSESELADGASQQFSLDQILARAPTPDEAAQMSEECARLLGVLEPKIRQIALHKLNAHTNDEIAKMMGVVPRTIERKLELVRSIWSEQLKKQSGR